MTARAAARALAGAIVGAALISAVGVVRAPLGIAQTVSGDVAAGKRKAEGCVPCHGPEGNASNPAVPSLAGQVPLYTYYQLIQFREGRRVDAQMSPLAKALSDQDMQDLAVYFAAQPPVPGPAVVDRVKAEEGWRASQRHYCESCHRPRFMGQNQVPRLTALSYDYLLRQLRGYKAQTRADIDLAMTMAAQPLTDADIEALAHYIAAAARTP